MYGKALHLFDQSDLGEMIMKGLRIVPVTCKIPHMSHLMSSKRHLQVIFPYLCSFNYPGMLMPDNLAMKTKAKVTPENVRDPDKRGYPQNSFLIFFSQIYML